MSSKVEQKATAASADDDDEDDKDLQWALSVMKGGNKVPPMEPAAQSQPKSAAPSPAPKSPVVQSPKKPEAPKRVPIPQASPQTSAQALALPSQEELLLPASALPAQTVPVPKSAMIDAKGPDEDSGEVPIPAATVGHRSKADWLNWKPKDDSSQVAGMMKQLGALNLGKKVSVNNQPQPQPQPEPQAPPQPLPQAQPQPEVSAMAASDPIVSAPAHAPINAMIDAKGPDEYTGEASVPSVPAVEPVVPFVAPHHRSKEEWLNWKPQDDSAQVSGMLKQLGAMSLAKKVSGGSDENNPLNPSAPPAALAADLDDLDNPDTDDAPAPAPLLQSFHRKTQVPARTSTAAHQVPLAVVSAKVNFKSVASAVDQQMAEATSRGLLDAQGGAHTDIYNSFEHPHAPAVLPSLAPSKDLSEFREAAQTAVAQPAVPPARPAPVASLTQSQISFDAPAPAPAQQDVPMPQIPGATSAELAVLGKMNPAQFNAVKSLLAKQQKGLAIPGLAPRHTKPLGRALEMMKESSSGVSGGTPAAGEDLISAYSKSVQKAGLSAQVAMPPTYSAPVASLSQSAVSFDAPAEPAPSFAKLQQLAGSNGYSESASSSLAALGSASFSSTSYTGSTNSNYGRSSFRGGSSSFDGGSSGWGGSVVYGSGARNANWKPPTSEKEDTAVSGLLKEVEKLTGRAVPHKQSSSDEDSRPKAELLQDAENMLDDESQTPQRKKSRAMSWGDVIPNMSGLALKEATQVDAREGSPDNWGAGAQVATQIDARREGSPDNWGISAPAPAPTAQVDNSYMNSLNY